MNPILRQRLDQIIADGRQRFISEAPAADVLDFSGNDYLNLARHLAVVTAANEATLRYGAGARAARLMAGSHPYHAQLEQTLADWLGMPATLLYGSGYLANAGTLAALAQKGDALFVDKLVHASIIDGLRLTPAEHIRYRHNDLAHLEKLLASHSGSGLKIVVTESVFSMDGDTAPLAELIGLARRYEALVFIDEAHALGVHGPHGAGLCSELPANLRPDIITATLGKALGSYGAFCACSTDIKDYLINTARTFIFSTALPPAAIAAAQAAIELCSQNPLGADLLERAKAFHAHLGLTTQFGSQIIPIAVGDNRKAVAMANKLRERNIHVTAIRPPTVPPGTTRLRLSVTLAHTPEQLKHAADVINEVMCEQA